jgi:signal transduction histidine kinase
LYFFIKIRLIKTRPDIHLSIIKLIFIYFLILLNLTAKSLDIQKEKTAEHSYYFSEGFVEYLEDDQNLTIEEITSATSNHKFKPISFTSNVLKKNKNYWIKIDLNHLKTKKSATWIIEFYDFRISEFDFYSKTESDNFEIQSVGYAKPFFTRNIKHKNFVFEVTESKNDFVYARIYSNRKTILNGRIVKIEQFIEDATIDYLLLCLFYGICIAMIVYNFFLYLTINDKTYLFFLFHIIGAVLFSFARDGLGFQLIWSKIPLLNNYAFNFANTLMIVWEIMYARSFLNTAKTQPAIDKLLKKALVIRIGIYLFTAFIAPQYSNICFYDIAFLFIVLFAGYKSYKENYRPATYFFVAFACMLVGYIAFLFGNLFLSPIHPLPSLFLNMGLVGEMLLLSFALASRIKILQKEKILAQTETINQLTLNEELKDEVNRELEQKVQERTIALEAKNRELDAFVYKSSHDLKGPLNSISGLATIGMMANDIPTMKEYFRLTRETSKRLQSTIEDLLSLTKVKEATVTNKTINIENLLNEILEDFSHDQIYSGIVISKKIDLKTEVVNDESLIKSIIQNLVENGLKYRDLRKETQTLDIRIYTKNDFTYIEVKDNGIGIDSEDKYKIFDMFYKINPKSIGTGLGLHILKTALNKLNGQIDLTSEKGIGTCFIVTLPNKKIE